MQDKHLVVWRPVSLVIKRMPERTNPDSDFLVSNECLESDPQNMSISAIAFICGVFNENQSWALAVFSAKKVVFNAKAQVPNSENGLLLGKDP